MITSDKPWLNRSVNAPARSAKDKISASVAKLPMCASCMTCMRLARATPNPSAESANPSSCKAPVTITLHAIVRQAHRNWGKISEVASAHSAQIAPMSSPQIVAAHPCFSSHKKFEVELLAKFLIEVLSVVFLLCCSERSCFSKRVVGRIVKNSIDCCRATKRFFIFMPSAIF